MHTTSGRWRLGLILVITTAIFWGLLPIALKELMTYAKPLTITWFRFLIAACLLGCFLGFRTGLPSPAKLKQLPVLGLAVVVVVGLLGNYAFYMLGLSFITPESAQIMIQSSSILLLLGGLIVFKERFSFRQWLGFITFCLGILLFFNQRLHSFWQGAGAYGIGVLLIFFAGVLWAAYALAQKQLLSHYTSFEIMFAVYLSGTLVFLPIAELDMVVHLDGKGWLLLLFCSVNTLIAYGAFAESLAHLEATRVSAILASTPLLTLLFMNVLAALLPGSVQLEPLNILALGGALLVVLGSVTTALAV
jgi:drug/metabolite transporter (DMT)-like permease